MLDFRVNTFLTVCDTKNYTKAAEKLGLTQPAVTQHIKYIEELYNVRLFVKEGKNMRLTAEGELLRDMLITVRADCAKIGTRLHAANKKPNCIKMGATKAFGEYLLPGIIEKYLEEMPETKIAAEVENMGLLLNMLKGGGLDFIFAEGEFEKKAYNCKSLGRYAVVWVCSAKSGLGKAEVSVEDLFEERLIVREKGSGTRALLEKALGQLGYGLKNFGAAAEIGSVDAIKRLIANGCGIAFLPEAAVKEDIEKGIIKRIDVKGFDIYSEVNFITLKNTMFLGDFEKFFNFTCKNI